MKKPILLFIVNVDWFFLSHRLPIALEAIKQGYDVHVATSVTLPPSIFEFHNITLHPIPIKRGSSSFLDSFRAFFSIILLCCALKPQLIHCITLQIIVLAGIAARISRPRHIVHSFTGLGFSFTATDLKSYIRRSILLLLLTFSLPRNNATIIVQNQSDQQLLLAIAPYLSSSIVLIPGSGIDLDEYYYSPEDLSLAPDVLFASRLLTSKGLLEFYEASRLLPQYNFVIAGKLDIHNRECVPQKFLGDIRCSPNITYLGDFHDVKGLLRSCSIVALPSYREGLPRILIEAASIGRPIVTTDVPGCRDAIIPGVTGLLVPPRDPHMLAQAILKLLSDPDLRISMGAAARRMALKKFSIGDVLLKHMTIYRKIFD